MKKHSYHALAATLLVFALAGCTDAGNPVAVQTSEHAFKEEGKPAPRLVGFATGDFGFAFAPAHLAGENKLTGRVTFDAHEVFDDPKRTGAGTFRYEDHAGAWFQADIRELAVNQDETSTFSGPITAGSTSYFAPVWIYVWVKDGSGAALDARERFLYRIAPPGDQWPHNDEWWELTLTSGGLNCGWASPDVFDRKIRRVRRDRAATPDFEAGALVEDKEEEGGGDTGGEECKSLACQDDGGGDTGGDEECDSLTCQDGGGDTGGDECDSLACQDGGGGTGDETGERKEGN